MSLYRLTYIFCVWMHEFQSLTTPTLINLELAKTLCEKDQKKCFANVGNDYKVQGELFMHLPS